MACRAEWIRFATPARQDVTMEMARFTHEFASGRPRKLGRARNVTIHPTVKIEPVRGGVAARASEIGVSGHGRDTDRAVASVRSIVGIWARSLAASGQLEQALARLGVSWEDSGPTIDIKPRVLRDTV